MTARLVALGLVAAAALSGCSRGDAGEEPQAATSGVSTGTAAATLAAMDGRRRLTAALTATRLAPVLDGKGEYTLLAPSDAAFGALGDRADELEAQDNQVLLIAVLRGHVLPGRVTPEGIAQAIARKQGPVEMRTMGGGLVRFAEIESELTASNGAVTARLETGAQTASNGAVLPIDAVLLPPQ